LSTAKNDLIIGTLRTERHDLRALRPTEAGPTTYIASGVAALSNIGG
jgi:hypothetical protein